MDINKSENTKSVQYVKYKHDMSKKELSDTELYLNYIDKAVYVYLRKYMDKITYSTFVSVDTISKQFGLSRPTVVKSIDKLLLSGDIERVKYGRGYKYTFKDKNPKRYERISFDLLNNKNLSPKLKAFCISMQEYLYNKNTGVGVCNISSTQMAKLLGMSYNTYKKYINECKESGIVLSESSNLSGPIKFDLDIIGQRVLYLEKEMEDVKDKVNSVIGFLYSDPNVKEKYEEYIKDKNVNKIL